jgi:hypothetical protein
MAQWIEPNPLHGNMLSLALHAVGAIIPAYLALPTGAILLRFHPFWDPSLYEGLFTLYAVDFINCLLLGLICGIVLELKERNSKQKKETIAG